MPFLKEGIEPVKTVTSINNTTNPHEIEIIAVCDEADYEYEKVLTGFKNVKLIKNKYSMGIDASRSIGINQATAPVCLIIDGHMRFLNDDWVYKIYEAVNDEPSTLWCTKSLVLRDDMTEDELNPLQNFQARNLHYSTGAKIHISSDNNLPFGLKWLNGDEIYATNKNKEISCVLGANYCSSTEWLKTQRIFEGLLGYGYSEQYASVKNWVLGGKCKGLDSVGIAHIFRKSRPYICDHTHMLYNALFTAQTLFPDELDFFNFYINFVNTKAGHDKQLQTAQQMIVDRWDVVSTYRDHVLGQKKMSVVELFEYFNITYNMGEFGYGNDNR